MEGWLILPNPCTRDVKKLAGHRKLRLFWAVVMALFLVANLSGCIAYRPLRLPQLQEFERNVRLKYPLSAISCKYDYEVGVSITVDRLAFDEECAYTILGYLQPIVRDEEFIQDLFELFEEESHGEPNWENGRRPKIYVFLSVCGFDRYQFTTRATKEGYNSGRDPDSYTWDGYTTWYGTEVVNNVPQEIYSETIKEKIEQYSAP